MTTTRLQPLLLTERQVCHLLSLGRSSIRKLMASGELKYLHVGRSLRFHSAELERFVEEIKAQQET